MHVFTVSSQSIFSHLHLGECVLIFLGISFLLKRVFMTIRSLAPVYIFFRHLLFTALFALSAIGYGEDRVVILAEDNAAPWSFKDGTGCANEVVKAAFAAAKVEIDLQVVPYERAKQMILKGKAVACFSMSWDPTYEGKVAFADQPLFICQCDYLHLLSHPLSAKKESDITTKIIVGTVVGYEYPPSVRRLQEKGLLVLEESPSEELNLKKLAGGRLDAILLNHNTVKTAQIMMHEAGVAGKVDVAFHCGELKAFVGFSLSHPRGSWARERFGVGFQIIKTDGTVRRIEQSWIEKEAKSIEIRPADTGEK